MRKGLVQIRIFHTGQSSKRRQDGQTRGSRMSRLERPVSRASRLRLEKKSTSSPIQTLSS